MAHYAFLDDQNIVTEVIVGVNETETIDGRTPEEWYGEFRNQRCVRTSYNGNIRKQFAGIGYRYDSTADVFICPSPYPSWVLDSNFDWQPPIPAPAEGSWKWVENQLSWVEVKIGLEGDV